MNVSKKTSNFRVILFFIFVIGFDLTCFANKVVKVGLLHSLTGNMAISEKAVQEATLLAIETINSTDFLGNIKLEPVIADGKSDPEVFAQQAERLITRNGVSVIFGCWTSASRKMVRPVVERFESILFYPVQFEGLENSKNIIYMGATPNQQLLPAVKWGVQNFGKRLFLVGSDYVFPRSANAIIRDYCSLKKVEIVGEEYHLLDETDFSKTIALIKESKPDFIINTINGESNIAFFKALRSAGFSAKRLPVISSSISENEAEKMGSELLAGSYASWNYFQTIKDEKNLELVRKFKEKYGAGRVVCDPMVAAYYGVFLWAKAVLKSDSVNTNKVLHNLKNKMIEVPGGQYWIDPENNHVWKKAYIGKADYRGQFEIIWQMDQLIEPVPFPISRTRIGWQAFLEQLYNDYNHAWLRKSSKNAVKGSFRQSGAEK